MAPRLKTHRRSTVLRSLRDTGNGGWLDRPTCQALTNCEPFLETRYRSRLIAIECFPSRMAQYLRNWPGSTPRHLSLTEFSPLVPSRRFNSWSRTQRNMRLPAVGGSESSLTANRQTRRSTKRASPATKLMRRRMTLSLRISRHEGPLATTALISDQNRLR